MGSNPVKVNVGSSRLVFTNFARNETFRVDYEDGEYVLRKIHVRGESGYVVAKLTTCRDVAHLLRKYVDESLYEWCEGRV